MELCKAARLVLGLCQRFVAVAGNSCLPVPVLVAFLSGQVDGGLVMFGSGANQFSLEFVPIGNAGNSADGPRGAVNYEYGMMKYEVTRAAIEKYNADYGTANGLEIPVSDMTPWGGNDPDKPARYLSWHMAARFVNWLNTSQGYHEAYKFTGSGVDDAHSLWTASEAGYDPDNLYRNSLARFVLPDVDEWYKAAFYDPVLQVYYDYAVGSDTVPVSVYGGTDSGTVVYGLPDHVGPALATNAGGLSPYGVMAMDGNVREFMETETDGVNDAVNNQVFVAGGSWLSPAGEIAAGSFISVPKNGVGWVYGGFRVVDLQAASVPEPGFTLTLCCTFGGFALRQSTGRQGGRRRVRRKDVTSPA